MKMVSRFAPHGVVFIASMGIMIVELVASRLVAKYIGNSLYTWTSVIGIVLGGISLGNWLGGKLADRHPPSRTVPWVLLASSVLTVLIVVLDMLVGRLTGVLGTGEITRSVLLRSVILITVLFFLPAASLGMVSPLMAKYAIETSRGVGKTVGGIYAAGSLGSIGGTFLTGYILIPAFGLTMNILMVAAALAALSALMGGRRLASAAWLAVLLVLLLSGAPTVLGRAFIEARSPESRLLYLKDSAYSYIQVTDRPDRGQPPGGSAERTLRLDALIHNRHDPASPARLIYDYERIFAALTKRASFTPSFSTLTLGGGAFTLPAYLERHYPHAGHEVVEIDPDVVEMAHRYFDFPRLTRVRTELGDARTYVKAARGRARYDIVYSDAFNAFSVPAHLTTREFLREVADILQPKGLFLANVIDIFDSGRFLGAYINTMRAVFRDLVVFMPPGTSRSARTTFVVAAAKESLAGSAFDTGELRDEQGAVIAVRVSAEMLSELAARSRGTVLTDDHAPVENLMAPVFLRSVR